MSGVKRHSYSSLVSPIIIAGTLSKFQNSCLYVHTVQFTNQLKSRLECLIGSVVVDRNLTYGDVDAVIGDRLLFYW